MTVPTGVEVGSINSINSIKMMILSNLAEMELISAANTFL